MSATPPGERSPSATTRPEIATIPSAAKPKGLNALPESTSRRVAHATLKEPSVRAPCRSMPKGGVDVAWPETGAVASIGACAFACRTRLPARVRYGAAVTGDLRRREKGRRTRWEGYRVRLSRGGAKARLRDGIAPISRALPEKVQSPAATFDRLCNKMPGMGSRGIPCPPPPLRRSGIC